MSTSQGSLNASPPSSRLNVYSHPLRSLAILAAFIFFAEMVSMTVLYFLKIQNYIAESLLDGLIMVVLILPGLYFLQLKPLINQMESRDRAEDALRASESLFRKVLEFLPVGVWITDPRGQIIHGNPASQQIWAGARYVGIEEYGEYKGWWADTGKRIEPEQWAAARAISQGESILNEEVEIETFDGKRKFILNSAVPILDEQGTPQGAIIVNQDNTQRRRAQRELIRTNELLKRFFSSIGTSIAYMDKDFNFIRVNDTYARSAGHTPEFFVGKNHFRLYPHEENQAIFQRVVETGEPYEVLEKPFEYAEYPERGVTYWDWSLQPAKGPDGAVQGVVLSLVDVTKRKRAEIQLARQHQELLNVNQELIAEIDERKRIESQLIIQTKAVESERQRFNDVLEILPAYLILLTPDYHVSFANRFFRERFGEDQGRHCYEYLFGRSEACEICETYRVLKDGTSPNWEWTGPDGHTYDVFDFPFTDVDGSTLILEMGIDITTRKQAEEKLRLLNAYNRSLIEANLDALVTITPDGKIGDVNSVTEAITGFTREELIGTDFHSYFTEPEKARAGYQQVFEMGSVRDYELDIQHKDGYTTPVIYNASIYRDEAGNVTGVFAAARDITERKQAERQLVLLTTALEAAANGIIVTDITGSILWSNSAFSGMTGFAHEEVIGQNPRLIKSGKQDPTYYQELWNTILAGDVWHGELINRRKDGSLYYEEQTITPVIDQKKNITNFISIKQDITDHKRAEQQLERQNQKLFALSKAERWQRELAEGLMQATIVVNSSLKLDLVLSSILEQIRKAIPFQGADIVLVQGQSLHVASFLGFEDYPRAMPFVGETEQLEDKPLRKQVYQTQLPKVLNSVAGNPDWRPRPSMEWVRSYVAVPLLRAGSTIGIINLYSEAEGTFDKEAVKQLIAFAGPAATALHNAQLYYAETNARQVAETLSAAAQALTQTLDLDTIISTLLESIEAIIHSDLTGIALLEGERRLAVRGVRGNVPTIDAEQVVTMVFDIDTSPLLELLIAGHKSILIPDIATSPSWQALAGLEPIQSWLGVPLIASDKVIGAIGMGRTEKDTFTQEQIQWAEALVGQSAIAIQNAWLFEQVRASSERLQNLARKLVDIQEAERITIARELHDEAGQALSSMMLSLGQLEQDADCPVHVRQRLQQLKEVADSVLEDLHRLAMDLRPVALDRLGLVAALEQLAHRMNTDWLSIRFKAVGFTGERLSQRYGNSSLPHRSGSHHQCGASCPGQHRRDSVGQSDEAG